MEATTLELRPGLSVPPLLGKLLPDSHQRHPKQVQAPVPHILHRLGLLIPNPPNPIKRTRLNKDQITRLQQRLLQLLVLPKLELIPMIRDLFPVLDPRVLVERRDHPSQLFDVPGVGVRVRGFFEDQLEGVGV